MAESSIVGTRIRERRILSGLRQSELARLVGISPSYLNLIEHNRRRIGGKTLIDLAEALKVEPAILSQGAEAALIAALQEAAADPGEDGPELDRIEEFAGRFPGWAKLLTDLYRKADGLEQAVATLTDRLAHDPYLADSLHEVISTVTAIRSTASILADTKELEPEWQNRFHRNINEDSRRLAEGAESLVRYLERAPDTEAEIRSPQDEMHAFLAEKGYHLPALEGDANEAAIDILIDSAVTLTSDAGRSLTRGSLTQYLRDAREVPLQTIMDQVGQHGLQPDVLAQQLEVGMPVVFRRLASLPESEVGPVGLVCCDGSGAITFRKPLSGFDVPRGSWACALWPLFQVLGRPYSAVQSTLQQVGRAREQVCTMAVAEQPVPVSFSEPALLKAYMLILPTVPGTAEQAVRKVGVNCPICPVEGCAARREPSIISKGF